MSTFHTVLFTLVIEFIDRRKDIRQLRLVSNSLSAIVDRVFWRWFAIKDPSALRSLSLIPDAILEQRLSQTHTLHILANAVDPKVEPQLLDRIFGYTTRLRCLRLEKLGHLMKVDTWSCLLRQKTLRHIKIDRTRNLQLALHAALESLSSSSAPSSSSPAKLNDAASVKCWSVLCDHFGIETLENATIWDPHDIPDPRHMTVNGAGGEFFLEYWMGPHAKQQEARLESLHVAWSLHLNHHHTQPPQDSPHKAFPHLKRLTLDCVEESDIKALLIHAPNLASLSFALMNKNPVPNLPSVLEHVANWCPLLERLEYPSKYHSTEGLDALHQLQSLRISLPPKPVKRILDCSEPLSLLTAIDFYEIPSSFLGFDFHQSVCEQLPGVLPNLMFLTIPGCPRHRNENDDDVVAATAKTRVTESAVKGWRNILDAFGSTLKGLRVRMPIEQSGNGNGGGCVPLLLDAAEIQRLKDFWSDAAAAGGRLKRFSVVTGDRLCQVLDQVVDELSFNAWQFGIVMEWPDVDV